MINGYTLKGNDMKTMIFPYFNESSKEEITKKGSIDGIIRYFIDALTRDYFKTSYIVSDITDDSGTYVRKLLAPNNNILEMHIGIIDKENIQITKIEDSSKAEGIMISSSIHQAEDLRYLEDGSFVGYTPRISLLYGNIGNKKAQTAYKDIFTAMLCNRSIEDVDKIYKNVVKPFNISSSGCITFNFFNPEKERLITATEGFNSFMQYAEDNKEKIMDIARVIADPNIDDVNAEYNNILSGLQKKDFSNLEALTKTRGFYHFHN